jgi:uncharacterized protein (TIGR02246 family)
VTLQPVIEPAADRGKHLSMDTGDDALAARLQRLEDLEEIRQLFVDYGRYLDQRDFDAYAELFCEDGELLLGPIGRVRGRAAIGEHMRKILPGDGGGSYHLVTNPRISLDGDEARAEVMWSVVSPGADGQPVLSMLGRHRDVLAREGGRWRFRRREGHIDVPARYPAAADA